MITEWRCAGCGAPSPNRARSCDCATACVYRGDENATKIDAEEQQLDEEFDRLHTQIACLRVALRDLIADCSDDKGEWPALDRARAALK